MRLLEGRDGVEGLDAEALIKEARRLRRRRWAIGGTLAILLGATGIAVATTGGSGDHGSGSGQGARSPIGPIGNNSRATKSAVAISSSLLPYFGLSELIAPGTGWVMSGTLTAVTTDGGRQWEPFHPPALGADFIANVEGFASYGSHDWWIGIAMGPDATTVKGTPCGNNQSVLNYTTDAGSSWSTSCLPNCQGAAELSFVSAMRGFAVGGWPSFTLYSTVDGGKSWHSVGPVPLTGPFVFSSSSVGWGIATANRDSDNGVALYRTTNGGRNWERVALPAPALAVPDSIDYGRPEVVGSAVVIVPAMTVNASGTVLRMQLDVSRDAGATWSTVSTPSLKGSGSSSNEYTNGSLLSVIDSDHWILGVGDRLYETSDDGASWAPVTTVFAAVGQVVENVQFVSRSTGWVSTNEVATAGSSAARYESPASSLYETTDGGKRWTLLSGTYR